MKNIFRLFVFTTLLVLFSVTGFTQQPQFRWAQSMLPESNFIPFSIDKWDNTYVPILLNYSTSFAIGDSVYSFTTTPGEDDIFICKLDPIGNLIWKKRISINGTASPSGGLALRMPRGICIFRDPLSVRQTLTRVRVWILSVQELTLWALFLWRNTALPAT